MMVHDVEGDGRPKRVGAFVIAYNAESHIEETLKRVPEEIWDASTATPIGIAFPFLLKRALSLLLNLPHTTTKVWKRRFPYQGIFYRIDPNGASLL